MLGRAHAQRVQTAVHVGVFVFIIIADDIQNGARFLRAGSAIEVNQGMTVDALPQNWKIFAERGPIHPTSCRLVHEIICAMRRFAPVYSGHSKIDILRILLSEHNRCSSTWKQSRPRNSPISL